LSKLLAGQWWLQRPKKWFAYTVLCTVSWLGFFYFRVLNWTKVEGKDKFRKLRREFNNSERRNVIIVSNHQTMFDSFVVGIIAYFPEILFWPSVAPYHFAAQENYFKNWLIGLILYCLRALPVKPGRKDIAVMNKVLTLLPKANVHIFPGGRRSYKPLGTDLRRPVRAGVGYILANAPEPKPLVIPVFIGGVEKIFGGLPGTVDRARWFPRLTGVLRRPLVRFGDPVEWHDVIAKKGNSKEVWVAIAKRVADAINQLDPYYQTKADQ